MILFLTEPANWLRGGSVAPAGKGRGELSCETACRHGSMLPPHIREAWSNRMFFTATAELIEFGLAAELLRRGGHAPFIRYAQGQRNRQAQS